MLILKDYQHRALEALRDYFTACHRFNDVNTAFYDTVRKWYGSGVDYNPVSQFQDLPYVCLRIPTGGGKTLVSCHACGTVQREYLGQDHSLILWLVPSNPILEQTINALKDHRHPYRLALESVCGPIEVMNLSEALYLQRALLIGQTVVIVSTMQAFRVEDTEGRKVYEQAGSLKHHFDSIPPEKTADLDCYPDTRLPVPSLSNVLRLNRPVVIVDEAHNARTDLSFDTLARFKPSCILEFTATPQLDGANRSNVLYRTSAAELKAENMIKIPVQLEIRPDWKQLLADAIASREGLEQIAAEETRATGEQIRPVMLLQAQRRSQTHETLTHEVLLETLLNDFNIPRQQIAVETGQQRELEGVDINDFSNPVRYVITVDALREGWDCPSAYVLYTVAESYSSRAVEQLLGRILRLPKAMQKQAEVLNISYAFASSRNWHEVANSLRDALVSNGFERLETKDLITYNPIQAQLFDDTDGQGLPLWSLQHTVTTEQAVDLSRITPEAAQYVSVDPDAKTVRFLNEVDDAVRDRLKKEVKDPAFHAAVDEAHEYYQNKRLAGKGQLRKTFRFAVPYLGFLDGDLFEPFEKNHLLDQAWSLSGQDATLSEQEFSTQRPEGQRLRIDTDKQGHIEIDFLEELSNDLLFKDSARHWSESELVLWLDKNIPHTDISKPEMMAYLIKVIQILMGERGFTLPQLVVDKLRLKKAIEDKIEFHRLSAQQAVYQGFLFSDASPLAVKEDYCFEYTPTAYPASTFYDGRFGRYIWKKHYYDEVGDMNREEFECAMFLDQLPEVDYWVRNLERREDTSFWLQTATDKFYPDFVCQLKDGRLLVVEYKGEDRWTNDDSKEKRGIGETWEKLSQGKCLFIMPKGKDLDAIHNKMNTK